MAEPFFFIRSSNFIQSEDCKGEDSVHKYLLSTYPVPGMVLGARNTAMNKIGLYAHEDCIVGQRQEGSMTDYIEKQFPGHDCLFTVIKSYEKTKLSNMHNIVCVWDWRGNLRFVVREGFSEVVMFEFTIYDSYSHPFHHSPHPASNLPIKWLSHYLVKDWTAGVVSDSNLQSFSFFNEGVWMWLWLLT